MMGREEGVAGDDRSDDIFVLVSVHTFIIICLCAEPGVGSQVVQRARRACGTRKLGWVTLGGYPELPVERGELSADICQYFISIKIRKAKELLEAGDVPIKEVAWRLGFNDQYYFSRLFRKKTGIASSRWSSFVHQ